MHGSPMQVICINDDGIMEYRSAYNFKAAGLKVSRSGKKAQEVDDEDDEEEEEQEEEEEKED